MRLKNPFGRMAYITEKGVRPELVFKRYSIEPFKYLLKYLNNNNNCFTVGRNGVGKTMVLSLFNPKYQEALLKKKEKIAEAAQILGLLPKDIISIYVNIASPSIHLTRFQGKNLGNQEWQQVFGDYLGHILLKKLIEALEMININSEWKERIKIKNLNGTVLDEIAKKLSAKFEHLSIDVETIKSWEELKKYLNLRILKWLNAVTKLGSRTFIGPKETTNLIMPCLEFVSILRDMKVISEEARLFIIIDQYEILFDHRKIIDFRPVFNLAMQQAARGSTRIEFKIGVRPYGYRDNLQTIGSSSKLDLEKECKEIIIDEIIDEYYNSFIDDLTMKCLKSTTGYKHFQKPSDLFEKLAPIEEVKYYLGKSGVSNKHLTKFFRRQNLFNRKAFNRIELIKFIKIAIPDSLQKECSIWIETLLSVSIEKYLQSKNNEKITKSEIKEAINNYFKKIIGAQYNKCAKINKDCYCFENYDNTIELDKTFNTKMKEIRDGALFIICSAYKYPKKFFSGYKTLRLLSSKIVLHYIELVTSIIDENLLRNNDEINKISGKIQTQSIYRRSNRLFENISDIAPHGIGVKRLLRKLGIIFRKKQLETALNSPTPNGFSLNVRIIDIIKELKEKDILSEVLSYGFIEEVKQASTSHAKRYVYNLNNLLCPYFGISIRHFKVPINVKGNPVEFLKNLVDNNYPVKKLETYIKLQEESKTYKKIDEY